MLTTRIDLKQSYENLKIQHPKLRIRDAANMLNVSELELLELTLGEETTRLNPDMYALLGELKSLGYIMALTRNEYAVHERKGIYDNVSFTQDKKMGVAVNPDIDVRFFMHNWRYAYAVINQTAPDRTLHSLQFFDPKGEAIHKVYLTPNSDIEAFHALVQKYRSQDQVSLSVLDKTVSPAFAERPDKEIDIASFRQSWLDLKDTHDFHILLKKYSLSRTQALRLAPEGYAEKRDNNAIVSMLEKAAERDLPIMVFVGNTACIQIHTGPVKHIVSIPGWINVMDTEFNLHLKLDGIADTWITRKPTVDGIVTGLEVFDAQGELIIYCFGKRKPGIPEMEEWRALVAELIS